MTTLALVKLALQLINALVTRANAERERGLGRAEAMANSLQAATAAIAVARRAEAEADAAHRADPTDGAFDLDFMRKD